MREEKNPCYAVVKCDRKCARCGFNPKEQKRRLTTGYFRKIRIYRVVFNDYHAATIVIDRPGKQLIFKKGANY